MCDERNLLGVGGVSSLLKMRPMIEMLDNVSIIHPGLEVLNLEEESVRVIQWHGFFSIILIGLVSVCGVVSTSGKVMIIHFH